MRRLKKVTRQMLLLVARYGLIFSGYTSLSLFLSNVFDFGCYLGKFHFICALLHFHIKFYTIMSQNLLMDVRDKLLFEPEYAGNTKEKVPPKSSLRIPWSWVPAALCLLQEVLYIMHTFYTEISRTACSKG